MLREFKYSSYYHAEMDRSSDEFAHLSVHADHCIEMLRASALCHGDGSLTTFKWSKNSPKPMLDLTRPSHTCVNWAEEVTWDGEEATSPPRSKYKYRTMGSMISAVYDAMRNGSLYASMVDCFENEITRPL